MLIQSLDPTEVLDHLIAGGYFSIEESQVIENQPTPQARCRKFLDILAWRGESAFECFLNSLPTQYDFLASQLRETIKTVAIQRERQGSLTDIHQALLHGDVPDRPYPFIERPKVLAALTQGLEWLASQFIVRQTIKDFSCATLDTAKLDCPVLDTPTNAWLLFYGMAGQGKSVMTAAALRQNHHILAEKFSGGVIWLKVGYSRVCDCPCAEADDQVRGVLSRLNEHVNEIQSPCGAPRLQEDDVNPLKLRIKRRLITRQYRKSETLDSDSPVTPSLFLIILDDMWDQNVIMALADLPAAFIVTSRDAKILQRVSGPVKPVVIQEDLTDAEAACLVASRAGMSVDCFLPGNPLGHIPPLCRGCPLTATLIGCLLSSPPHSVSHYLVQTNITGGPAPIIDWTKVQCASSYTYDSFYEAVLASLNRLSPEARRCYEKFVIFEDDCPQTAEVFAVYWSCTTQEAVEILMKLYNLSLVQCAWKMEPNRYVYFMHNLQLDLLRASVSVEQQQAYHSEFVDKYMARFGDQWVRLADSPTDHTYFCQSVGEHLLKTARYAELIQLLTNLKFNCACLLILGPSAVVAEFRRYRPIFEAMGRISDWHTYLRFLQTTAYQLINPDSSVRALHIRARSPTRPGSLADVTCGKEFLLAGCTGLQRRSMTPDDGVASGLNLSAAPASLLGGGGGGTGKHRSPSAFRSPSRKDEPDRRVVSPKRVGMSKNLMIKGLDLVQLGLTLPHDNAIFQQSVNIISSSNSKDHRTPKYYWFCSNISTSGTELLWATRTGTATITAIAAEPDYTFLPPTLRRRMRPADDRSINRQLVGTSDGRIIILDATSGYEVAVHQVHKPSVEVKTICLLPGGQACLSCGSDGSMIVSTLPPLDPSPKSPTTPRNRTDDCASKRSPEDQFFDTIDVDEVEDSLSEESELYDAPNSPDCDNAFNADQPWFSPGSASPFQNVSAHYATTDVPSPSYPSDSPSAYYQHRSCSPVLQEAEFPTYTTAPTVLADLPALVEICRLSDASPKKVTDTSEFDAPTQICIALSPMGTCMLFADSSPTSCDATSKEGPKLGKIQFELESEKNKKKGGCDTNSTLTLSMYSLLTGSPGSTKVAIPPSKFALVKCRDLILPSQIPPKNFAAPLLPSVLSAVISSDDSMIGCGLSNGRLWIYSLDEVGWVACISTAISAKADPFTAAPISTRTPRPRTDTSPFQQATDSELAELAFADGPIVNACAFLSWPYESRVVISSSPWTPPSTPLCAAAVGGFICVWSFQNKLPANQLDLQTTSALLASSRCQFRLRCPLGSFAHSLDTHTIGTRCLLAAGMTNGRVMIWSLPELSKIFDVCAHRFMVTSVRLFPHGNDRSSGGLSLLTLDNGLSTRSSPLTSSLITVCLTAGSTDGVVKSFELEWNGFKNDSSSFGTAQPIPEIGSPSLNSAALPRHVNAWRRGQPHPLWAELFDVVFGQRGYFLAIGRIKASCNLQLLYRNTEASGTGLTSVPESHLCCVEVDVSSSHPFAQRRRPLVPISTSATPVTVENGANGAMGDNGIHHPPQPSTAAERTKLIVPSSAVFSKDFRLLAIGYESGFIDLMEFKSHNQPQAGFTRRCVLTIDPISSKAAPGSPRVLPSNLLPSARKIIHLSIWCLPLLKPVADADPTPVPPSEAIVTAVTACGTVYVWLVSLSPSSPENSPLQLVHPYKFWQRMHQLSCEVSPGAPGSEETFDTCSSRVITSPIVWFQCLSHLVPLQLPATAAPAAEDSDSATLKYRLAWLSAGRDGCLYGRPLCPPKCPIVGTEWSLSLAAHRPFEITDADVDPCGCLVVTASTDQSLKVWCLSTSKQLFEASHKPSPVRCVKFRPVAEQSRLGTEIFLASGDDAGTLRIWCMTIPKNPDRSAFWHRRNFSSDAPSAGGSWLLRLCWSADGSVLSGLSDRLCVWPFARTETGQSRPHGTGAISVGTRSSVLQSSVKSASGEPSQLELFRCRVLQVFDSPGHADYHGCPLRSRLFVGRVSSLESGPRLLPTLVTIDSSSGDLLVFDPIEMLLAARRPISPPT